MERDYCIDGRHFRTKEDYEKARKDKDRIDSLREKMDFDDEKKARIILEYIRSGKIRFQTILGKDFEMELEDLLDDIPGYDKLMVKQTIRDKEERPVKHHREELVEEDEIPAKKPAKNVEVDEEIVAKELRKIKLRRIIFRYGFCSVALVCFILFGIYEYQQSRTLVAYDRYEKIKEESAISPPTDLPTEVIVHKTPTGEAKEVLDEYKNLLNINKKLIGWVKIDDTNINYPVMQTDDNEYYLSHNMEQENDKNGSIFMDKDCDVLKPSTNFILYGHRMQSGAMFGKLSKYEDAKYLEKHKYIEFDTIYEKGIYQVMYVFRSTIMNENDVGFKYYQFIDANSETEFDSNMQQMAAISLVDTGVTAVYGDQLLTLSTCDYYDTNGRFVVVAKKVPAKE